MGQKSIKQDAEASATERVVRRDFTMLPAESDLIDDLRYKYQAEAISRTNKPVNVTRTEIIRAGIKALDHMSPRSLYRILTTLTKPKEGRPKMSRLKK